MDNNIQSVDSQAQPPIKPYIPPETQTKKINKGLIIGAAAGFVLIVAIVLVLVLLVLPSSGSGAQASEPLPLIYMEDDEVYLVVGTRTVELEGAAVKASEYGNDEVNGQISYDGRYFVYLSDVDEETGAGDLMLIDLQGDLKPKVIEEDVCSARMSAYGDYIIFFKDVENKKGTLFYAGLGKKAQQIEDDVMLFDCGISIDGKSYYYTQHNGNTYDLYVCVKGAEPEKAIEVSSDKGERIFIRTITNEGAVVYEYSDNDDTKLYIYKNGNKEKIASDARVELTFDHEYKELLYSSGDSLYYKAMDENKERITKDFYSIVYSRDHILTNLLYSKTFNLDTHFVFAENEDKEREYPDEVTLYEMRVGREPIEITEADVWSYSVSNNLEWLSFEHNEELCLIYKDRNEWSDRIEICELSMNAVFDEGGQYLYYIELGDEDDESGDLYRYHLTKREHEPELLQYDVVDYYLYNDTILTINSDIEIYNVNSKDNKELLFDEEYVDLEFAPNGIYIYTEANDYDIYYITLDGDQEEICFDATKMLDISYYITHYIEPAVPEDLIDVLSVLYEDVRYIQDVLNDNEVPGDVEMYKEPNEHLDELESLMTRDDISGKAFELINSFYKGFVQVDVFMDAEIGSDEEKQSVENLNVYFDEARELFEQLIGESTVDPLY